MSARLSLQLLFLASVAFALLVQPNALATSPTASPVPAVSQEKSLQRTHPVPSGALPPAVTYPLELEGTERLKLSELKTVRLTQPLSTLSITPDMGLDVGIVTALAIDGSGMMWIGGSRGLQQFDGRHLSQPIRFNRIAAPQARGEMNQLPDIGLVQDRVVGIDILRAKGNTLYFADGENVYSYEIMTGVTLRTDPKVGWVAIKDRSSSRYEPQNKAPQWCQAGENHLVLLSEPNSARELRVVDLRTGMQRSYSILSAPTHTFNFPTQLCNEQYVVWIDYGLSKIRQFRLNDGALRDIALPPVENASISPDDVWSLLAWSLDGQAQLGTAKGIFRLDFERGLVLPDEAIQRALAEYGLSQPTRESWRVRTGSRRQWVSRRGAELLEVSPDGAIALHRLDWKRGLGGAGSGTPTFDLAVTTHGAQDWIWLLQGEEGVVGYVRDHNASARSTTVMYDDSAQFRRDIWMVCDDTHGNRWIHNSAGQIGIQAGAAPSALHVFPGNTLVHAMRCMGNSLWAVTHKNVMQLSRQDGELVVQLWKLPSALQTTRLYLQYVDDHRLLMATLQHVMVLDVNEHLLSGVELQGYFYNANGPQLARPDHAQALLTGPNPGVATLLSTDLKNAWGLTDQRQAPVDQQINAVKIDAASWIDSNHLLASERTGALNVLQLNGAGVVSSIKRLRTLPWLNRRITYCMMPAGPNTAMISTSGGIARVSTKDGTAEYMMQMDGVHWMDFNSDACSLRGNVLLFGSTSGWTEIDISASAPRTAPPQPILQMVGEGSAPMRPWQSEDNAQGTTLAMIEEAGVLRLQFGANRFEARQEFDLLYRLKGIEQNWRRSAAAGRLEFAGLSAGQYQIEYGYADDSGGPKDVYTLALTVKPPWWRSHTALTGLTLLLIGVATIWYLQLRRNMNKLQASRQQLSLALEGSSGVLWDRTAGKVTCTDAPWLGMMAAELSGSVAAFESRIHPDDLPRYRAAMQLCESGKSKDILIEYRLKHASGRWVWVRDAGRVVVREAGASPRIVGTLQEISRVKQIEEELRHMASTDELTGLPNRRECNRAMEAGVVRAIRQATSVCVLYLDLNQFKTINDSLGHTFGDSLLRAVAGKLAPVLPAQGSLYRLGGDEFVACLPDCDIEHGMKVGHALLSALATIRSVNHVDVRVAGSIGIAACPEHATTPRELLQYADAAMYAAKTAGPPSIKIFDTENATVLAQRAHVEAALAKGVERGHFALAYQPIVEARTRRVRRYEALLRWQHPRFSDVSLARVIDILETTGLIREVGAWVIDQACQDYAALCALQPTHPAPILAVNISVHQLRHTEFTMQLDAACRRHGVPPDQLEIEITESALASEHLPILNGVRALGVNVSIDDFGVGYSSLAYLRTMPANTLKIDKSFVDHIDTNESARKLCLSLISMAQTLDLAVIAEGVEREDQLQHLQSGGCDEVQGYLFSRPQFLPALQASHTLSQLT